MLAVGPDTEKQNGATEHEEDISARAQQRFEMRSVDTNHHNVGARRDVRAGLCSITTVRKLDATHGQFHEAAQRQCGETA